MIYSRENDEVTLEMTIQEYAELLAFLGALLMLSEGTMVAKECSHFVEAMNRTNKDHDLYRKLELDIERKYGADNT